MGDAVHHIDFNGVSSGGAAAGRFLAVFLAFGSFLGTFK